MSAPATAVDATPALPTRPVGAASAAVAGLAAGALALGVAEFVAALTEVVGPVAAVGAVVVESAPGWLDRWAIDTLGPWNKPVLRSGIVALLALMAAILGRRAARRATEGTIGVLAVGAFGAWAAASRQAASIADAVPSVLGAVIGAWTLHRLTRRRAIEVPGPSVAPRGVDRRRFVAGATASLAGAGALGGAALALGRRRADEVDRSAPLLLPLPDEPATLPNGVDLDPTTPFLTPTDDFYRIDTALSIPRRSLESWELRVTGLVEREVRFGYRDLLELPQVERIITLCCVSNEVGGPYVGNARWQGVHLRDLLDRAGVLPQAEQVFSTSIDGWTCGFPVAAAFDGRDAMIAIGMNGEPLPREHGFPARLVVPGLYGYVSATKWLQTIELATWEREGYWIPRGWSREGPVKIQSRIGTPRHSAQLTGGPVPIAGVAWAQGRGIAAVEVRIDDGAWISAQLASDVSDDTWRQWIVDWDATPGEHTISVRATGNDGEVQTERRSPVAPDGATGHHTIRVTVD